MIEHKNTILAIVLSLVVVVGWQYFVGYPQMEKQRHYSPRRQLPPPLPRRQARSLARQRCGARRLRRLNRSPRPARR